MPSINTAIRYIPDDDVDKVVPSGCVDLTDRFRELDNASFLAAVARDLQKWARKRNPGGTRFDPGGVAAIGLLGEYGLLGYGIRRAQELIRVDHTPSFWSHAFLFFTPISTDAARNRDAAASPWIWESSLEPSTIFNHFANRNGVSPRRVADYALASFEQFAPHCAPNIAVLAIALTEKERKRVLWRADDADVDQLHYDISGLQGDWYAFLTNPARKPNPLIEGKALHAAAYLQLAYDAVGIDLSPGSNARNTAPEHIWQAAKYFRRSFRALDAKGNLVPRQIRMWSCVRDKACLMKPVDLKMPRRLSDIVKLREGTTGKKGRKS